MPDTFIKIASVTVGSGGASSIDFTSIPSTYTDLVVLTSFRCTTTASNGATVKFNGSSSSYSEIYLVGTGSGTLTGTQTIISQRMVDSASTSNTFTNTSLYIPNYAGSSNKSTSTDSVAENNSSSALMNLNAGLWSNTSAINQVSFTPTSGGNFAQYSTAVLYGISKS